MAKRRQKARTIRRQPSLTSDRCSTELRTAEGDAYETALLRISRSMYEAVHERALVTTSATRGKTYTTTSPSVESPVSGRRHRNCAQARALCERAQGCVCVREREIRTLTEARIRGAGSIHCLEDYARCGRGSAGWGVGVVGVVGGAAPQRGWRGARAPMLE